jgi:hypothetical protein
MLCKNCGNSIDHQMKACPKCGLAVSGSKQNRFLVKLVIGVSFVAVALTILMAIFSAGPSAVVKEQLAAIKEKHYSDAYYNFTSKSFQEVVSLNEFRQFIDQYPAFLTSPSARIDHEKIQDGLGYLEATLLTRQGGELPVYYRLLKEGDKWKVLSIKLEQSDDADSRKQVNNAPLPEETRFIQDEIALAGNQAETPSPSINEPPSSEPKGAIQSEKVEEKPSEAEQAPLFDPKPIYSVIESQLGLIRQGKLLQSYNLYTSQEFQKFTTFKEYSAFLSDHPGFINNLSVEFEMVAVNNNVVIVTGNLTSRSGHIYPFEYNIVSENGSWKILHVQLYKEKHGNDDYEEKTHAHPAGVVFEKFVLGTVVNSDGVISSGKTTFAPSDGQIHLNLYLKNAKVGTKISVDFEHLDSHSLAPVAKATVPEDGDLILSFAFTPPAKGWPKGHYLVSVSADEGQGPKSAEGSIEFKVE